MTDQQSKNSPDEATEPPAANNTEPSREELLESADNTKDGLTSISSPSSDKSVSSRNESTAPARTGSLNIQVKHSSLRTMHNISAEPDWDVLQLKRHIETVVGMPTTEQRLVFSGRVLVNARKIEFYNISEGSIIHLLHNPQRQVPQPTTTSMNFPRNTSMGGPSGDFMQQMLDSPMMQNMLDNPDILRMMMENSSEMQQLCENNPDLNQLLNDPEVLRQSFDMMRNPSLMREMMRNTDRAMANIEALPGGFHALTRLYHTIQEPMHSATIDAASGSNQRRSQQTISSATTDNSHDIPITEMPNPWATPSRPTRESNNLHFMGRSMPMMPPSQPRPTMNRPPVMPNPPLITPSDNEPFGAPQLTDLLAAMTTGQGSSLADVQERLVSLGLSSPTQEPINTNQFSAQLEVLQNMGFSDRAACLRALEQTGGNLNRAIDILLQGSLG